MTRRKRKNLQIFLKDYKAQKSVKKKYLTELAFSCMIAQVIKMEQIVKQTLLYDFYGELLTEHQKQIYEDVVFGDLSLSEAADDYGISRQGVHDLLKRCNRILEGYEEKLHLLEKFLEARKKAEEIHRLSESYMEKKDEGCIQQILKLSQELSMM